MKTNYDGNWTTPVKIHKITKEKNKFLWKLALNLNIIIYQIHMYLKCKKDVDDSTKIVKQATIFKLK